MFLPDWWR